LKKIYFFAILLIVLISKNQLLAQTTSTPDGIIFQALATDPLGNPAAGRTIYIKDAILQSGVNGQTVFSETFKVTASNTGVFTIVIGKGQKLSGPNSINNLDWSTGPYFLNIKAAVAPSLPLADWNADQQYVDMGTSQFWSVPFALYASNVAGFDLKLNIADTTNMLKQYLRKSDTASFALKEIYANKSTNITADALSDIKYPSVKSVKTYVDAQILSNPQGVQGLQGAVGASGPIGAQGPIGNKGPTGDKGLVGDKGATGDQGPQGIVGLTGATGLTGAIGIQGPQGIVGITGSTGVQGPIGDKGPVGDKGLSGDAGVVNPLTINSELGGGSFNGTTAKSISIQAGSVTNAMIANAAVANLSGTNTGDQNLSGLVVKSANLSDLSDNVVAKTNLGLHTVASSGSYTDLINTPSAYSLPKATALILGGIKVGTNLSVDVNGVLSASASGVPYTGATGAVNLGAYDLKVNSLTIGLGNGQNAQNTAIGANALTVSNSSGTRNTAIGYDAMLQYVGTSFDNNTSVGYQNLVGLTTGGANTSVGGETMASVGAGSYNTAIGNQTLRSTTNNGNTALGASAGNTVSTGSWNTLIGFGADVATGAGAITNSTALGNNASVAASNTIQLGDINVVSVNTAGKLKLGAITLPNTDGTANQVLATNGTGTASWATAGVPYTGASGAVNLGAYDLTVNGLTIGKGFGSATSSTVLGTSALSVNSSADYIVAVGYEALKSNTSGNSNTAVGYQALKSNVSGYSNTGLGYGTLPNNINGTQNVAVGQSTLFNNTSASGNTVVGYSSAIGTTTGGSNTAIGNSTFNTNTTGTNNTALGASANVGSNNLTNATVIGFGATVSADNTIRLGNSSVTTIGGQVSWTAASDIRLKKNISNSKYGLATVLKLRPVDYNLISNNLRQVGFIAQEVKKLVPEVVTGKEGDITKGEILGITYANLVPVLTKAIQEQQTQIEDQNKRIEKLELLVKQLMEAKK
jgi:hypothetical protein